MTIHRDHDNAAIWLRRLRRILASGLLPARIRRWGVDLVTELDGIYLPSRQWRRHVDDLCRDSLHDVPERSHDAKKAMFKAAVTMVEFEPHSYCNRHCTFCPNSIVSRRDNRTEMDIATYRRALEELAEIHYDGRIRFARYSEPLACRNIREYVSLARTALPDAEIDIITNGDYLNAELLRELIDAGLDFLRISVYPKGYVWDVGNACEQVNKIAQRIGIEPEVVHRSETALHWRFDHDDLVIGAYANDFNVTGFDRGQSLDYLVDGKWVRTSPCAMVFQNVTVDFTGAVVPCCNVRSDLPEHERFTVARLTRNGGLFDAYASKAMTEWRRHLVDVGPKQGICATCKQKVITSGFAEYLLHRRIKKRLDRIATDRRHERSERDVH